MGCTGNHNPRFRADESSRTSTELASEPHGTARNGAQSTRGPDKPSRPKTDQCGCKIAAVNVYD